MDTIKKKLQVLKQLKKTKGLVSTSCQAVNISRSVFYLWMNNDSDFKQKVEDIMDIEVEHVESKLFNLIESGNAASTIFYLKNKSKEYKTKIELSGDEDKPIIIKGLFNDDLIKDNE